MRLLPTRCNNLLFRQENPFNGRGRLIIQISRHRDIRMTRFLSRIARSLSMYVLYSDSSSHETFCFWQTQLITNLVPGLDHYSVFRFNHLLLHEHVAISNIHQPSTNFCRNSCSLNFIPQPRNCDRRPPRAQIRRLPTLHGRHPFLVMFSF